MSGIMIRVRITRRCMIDATTVGEPGQVVELPAPEAANLLGFGGGVAVDPVKAADAIKAWNAAALRIEAASMPTARPLSWVGGGRVH
jgi:hypothetical protein